jgi:uncharacterized protein (TIGR02391 family)
MRGHRFLPLIEAIAGNPEFPGNLGGGPLAGSEELHGLSFKFWCEPSSLSHHPPPWELSCPHLRCPSNPGQLTLTPGLTPPHPDVLRFCRAELVADNYFHAVLEATKSIADKIRSKTGLTDDMATLVDKTLAGDSPLLAINSLSTESQRSEQRGFVNLVKGTFGMFRNPTAHEARIQWTMNKADAEDLLSLASLIHRRLDSATTRKSAV